MWAYHSYISMQEDQNTGLIGSTIAYAAGKMEETMTSYREFVLVYMQYDESDSFLSQANLQLLTGTKASGPSPLASPSPALGQGYDNYTTWHPQLVNLGTSGQLNSTQAPTFRR
jgi:hypothetical protein